MADDFNNVVARLGVNYDNKNFIVASICSMRAFSRIALRKITFLLGCPARIGSKEWYTDGKA